MPRFFVSPEQISEGSVTVIGEDAHHISRSLRMAAGETVTVCNGLGKEFLCELTDFLPGKVIAKILQEETSETEPPYLATVFQALPKGDKLDSVIQKSVECGASEIIPFESERCIMRAGDTQKEATRGERRNRIALEAAKQCGRGRIPTVGGTISFAESVNLAAKAELALFCYEGEGTVPLPQVLNEFAKGVHSAPHTVSIMVGSEGGFSKQEAEEARKAGMTLIGLGKRILRTETAASFVLSCLVYAFEL